MDWRFWAGIVSGIVTSLCYVPYILDTVRGKTRPNRATWFIWAILGWIAFFSQIQSGATYSLIFILCNSLGPSVVFLLSIKKGEGGYEFLDIFSLVGAGVGLLAWYVTNRPELALYFNLTVDVFGVFPTLKSPTLILPGKQ